MPIVSICIPTYKQKEYLQKCLSSVLIQDFKDFELIITDDTPDDSIEIFLQSILGTTDYKYYRNSPALGPPENWNSGIKKATGKYIKILHHDDFFTQPDSLSLMVKEIEKQHASFLFCQTDVWHVKKNVHRINAISHKYLSLLKTKPEFLFFKNMIGSPSATLYENNLFEYNRQFKWLVDIEFYLKFLFGSRKVVYLDEPLISTAHDTADQLTGNVLHDKAIQINEHVMLFNDIQKHVSSKDNFLVYFDYLFYDYKVSSFAELLYNSPAAAENKLFYEKIILNIPRKRIWKGLKRRFYSSKYLNLFKFEPYL